jgi:hypothetical protein
VRDEMNLLFYVPFLETNLNISNEVYEEYEEREEITS